MLTLSLILFLAPACLRFRSALRKFRWVTLKNKKHIFIKDGEGSVRGASSSSPSSSNTKSNNSSNSVSSLNNRKRTEEYITRKQKELDEDNKRRIENKEVNKKSTGETGGAANINNNNNFEKSLENVQNMYAKHYKSQEKETKIAIQKLNGIGIKFKKDHDYKKYGIFNYILRNADTNLVQKGVETLIGNCYFGIIHNEVKNYCGEDTAGMLDLAHGENNMHDKDYIKDTIRIENWNDPVLSSDTEYWKEKLEGQFGRDGYNIDNIRGYFFKSNSEPVQRLIQDKDFKDMLTRHKGQILKGEPFSDKFPQYGKDIISKMGTKNNFKNAFSKVDFRHPYIDKGGNLHVLMCDTYDFNNEDNFLIQAGRNQMKKGNLMPFFTIHAIIISKNEVETIL